jgi:DNA ligase (NAD+)
MPVDTKQVTIQLRNLGEWREAYYNGHPIVSDAIYDDVEDQVREAATELPDGDKLKVEIEEFLARVGAPVPAAPAVPGGKVHWVKVKHRAPAGSLNKAQVASELKDWFDGCVTDLRGRSSGLVWSDKCDGISILLYYKDGTLEQAVTRGDGIEGEDITRNVVKMKGVVRTIKGFTGDIRGEIVLRKTDHMAHFPTYANPRNAASGLSKRLDGAGSEHLTVLHYRVHRTGGAGKNIPGKSVEFQILERLGAATPKWGTLSSFTEAETVYKRYVDGDREALDYDIDGLVFEFDDPTNMDTLGERNHRPRGAIAFKFPHDQKVTTLRNIRWQVGNTGRLTPVAEFDPVKLAGATVVQASLHNATNIAKLVAEVGQQYLFAGDQIVVSRRNDVIPYVEKVIEAKIGEDPPAFNLPTECPVCKAAVKQDGEYILCPNEECPAQVSGAIKKWVSKIGLKGVGETLIDTLCDQGIIVDASDLYTLDKGELADVQMDGRRVGGTADTVVDELHAKKELPLHVFIGSLNIPLCSRSTCQTIVDAGFDTLDKMRAATFADIAAVPGMGTGRGQAFTDGMKAKAMLINKLLMVGVTIKGKVTGSLTGQSFCFTGVRDGDLETEIEKQGGVVKSSAVKGLTYLIALDKASSSGKMQKARAQGTTIINLEEAWGMVGGR